MTMDDSDTTEKPRVVDKRKVDVKADLDDDTVSTAGAKSAHQEDDEREQLVAWLTAPGLNGAEWRTMSIEELREQVLFLQQKEAAENHEEPVDGLQVRTAFLVYVDFDGVATATADMKTLLIVEREAQVNDLLNASAQVVRDIERSATAQQTVALMQQVAMAQAQQAAAQRATSNPSLRRR